MYVMEKMSLLSNFEHIPIKIINQLYIHGALTSLHIAKL